VQGDEAMMMANQVVYSVIHNIAIAILIVILCFAFVGIVVLLDWLFTCVLDCFGVFSDREPHKKERHRG
jgi:hypothetical protein